MLRRQRDSKIEVVAPKEEEEEEEEGGVGSSGLLLPAQIATSTPTRPNFNSGVTPSRPASPCHDVTSRSGLAAKRVLNSACVKMVG
jgi:hypothetical protein